MLSFHKGNKDQLNNLLLPLWNPNWVGERAAVGFDERRKVGEWNLSVLMRCRCWCFVDVVFLFCWCFDELSVLMREERLDSGISSLCVSFDDAPLHLIWLGKVKEWIPGFSPLCVSFDAFDEREEKGQRADSRGFWAEEEYRGASRHALPRL